ncbi:PLP-dependent decarboxylase [Variovorax sp. J2P1-59]|uniref:PLP-dependent decarboxylase n=1 Tax=Variovorax flavidus TaxID=3053501 RepID=UPI002574D0C7|nr:PLP-dependent decarboxylase [Variovorax sp. J2P1-59]MDM0077523.1 PLP-dependent decarboxylase [Variovorax sp. J2P1-59]
MTPDLAASALNISDPAALARLETPCYLFDPAVLMDDLAALQRELGTEVVASVKACPLLDLLVRCSHALTGGIEIASLGELNLTMGRMSVPRFVNTPAMDRQLAAAAVACRATLVADSPHQIRLIEQVLEEPKAAHRVPLGIVLRVNAASLLEQQGPAADHFGMEVMELHRELARLSDGGSKLKVIGLHVFAGSHSFARSGTKIAQRLSALVADVGRYPAVNLELALIGAGLGGDWRQTGPDFAGYRESLKPLQAQVRVLHEAGRSIFSRAGHFATRVVATKELRDGPIVVCDGGLAQCFSLAQTEHFVKRRREPALVRLSDGPVQAATGTQPFKVVGSSCSPADVIGSLPASALPNPGDMLVFDHCGAYHSYSPTGFLSLRQARRYIAA